MEYAKEDNNGDYDVVNPLEFVLFAQTEAKPGLWLTKALKPTTFDRNKVKFAIAMFPLAFPNDVVFVRALNLN